MARLSKPEAIIVHHTFSEWGDVKVLRKWHTDPKPQGSGHDDVGYHKIICNGFPTYNSWREGKRDPFWDGRVQQGRADNIQGAQCPGWNARSLGVCLIGNFMVGPPTDKQWHTLVDVCARLCRRYQLGPEAVLGHGELHPTACPGTSLSMDHLRSEIGARLATL